MSALYRIAPRSRDGAVGHLPSVDPKILRQASGRHAISVTLQLAGRSGRLPRSRWRVDDRLSGQCGQYLDRTVRAGSAISPSLSRASDTTAAVPANIAAAWRRRPGWFVSTTHRFRLPSAADGFWSLPSAARADFRRSRRDQRARGKAIREAPSRSDRRRGQDLFFATGRWRLRRSEGAGTRERPARCGARLRLEGKRQSDLRSINRDVASSITPMTL